MKIIARTATALAMSMVLAMGMMAGILGAQAAVPDAAHLTSKAYAKTYKETKQGIYGASLSGLKKRSHALYKVTFSGSKLNVWGRPERSKSGKYESGTVLKYGKHVFKLTGKTQYLATGGDAPATKFSKAGFKKYLKSCGMNGLWFSVKVKNGKAVRVALSS